MTVEDLIHAYVLELLRRGFDRLHIAQALAQEKINLMQHDEYAVTEKEPPHGDEVQADE